MTNINQALILAAGRGERMKPLTDKIPKPLAKIKGKAMIDYILEKVSTLPEIKKIIVNSFYLAQVLEDHLRTLNNSKIIISHETEKLETGGGLINALPLFDLTKPILIINGDLFWLDKNNSLLKKLISSFNETKMDILLALKPKEQFFGYVGNGDFNLNKTTGELVKASNPSHTYIGAQILHPRIFKNIPSEKCFPIFNYLFKNFLEEDGNLRGIKGVEVVEKVFHIGTVRTLEDINIQ